MKLSRNLDCDSLELLSIFFSFIATATSFPFSTEDLLTLTSASFLILTLVFLDAGFFSNFETTFLETVLVVDLVAEAFFVAFFATVLVVFASAAFFVVFLATFLVVLASAVFSGAFLTVVLEVFFTTVFFSAFSVGFFAISEGFCILSSGNP